MLLGSHAFRCGFDCNSENILEATFHYNLERGTKMINEPIDIVTGSRGSNVIKICHNNDLVVCTNKDTGIKRKTPKANLNKSFRELLKPVQVCLLASMKSFVESKNHSIKTDTRWCYHPDFFNKISIPECRLDIQLLSLQHKVCSNDDDEMRGVMPRREWITMFSYDSYFPTPATTFISSLLIIDTVIFYHEAHSSSSR